MTCRVVSKFQGQKQTLPLAFVRLDVGTKHLLECAVNPLSLTVDLGMVGRGHALFDVKAATELVPQIRLEARIVVRYDHLWKTVMAGKTASEELHGVC